MAFHDDVEILNRHDIGSVFLTIYHYFKIPPYHKKKYVHNCQYHYVSSRVFSLLFLEQNFPWHKKAIGFTRVSKKFCNFLVTWDTIQQLHILFHRTVRCRACLILSEWYSSDLFLEHDLRIYDFRPHHQGEIFLTIWLLYCAFTSHTTNDPV